jgi:hypothetical protein
MRRKSTIIAAVVLVLAVAALAIGNTGQVAACDGKVKSASAAKVSAATASYSAGTAGTCSKTAQAKACCPSASAACCANKARQAHYAQVKELADDIPYRENTRLVIAGTVTCGSCDLGKTDKCQPFVKTADGDFYPLKRSGKIKEMKNTGSKEFEVTTRVTKEGGIKFLEVTSFKAI